MTKNIYTIVWKYGVGCYMAGLPVGRIKVFKDSKDAVDFVNSDDNITYIDSKEAYKLMRQYVKSFFGITEFENVDVLVDNYNRCFQF